MNSLNVKNKDTNQQKKYKCNICNQEFSNRFSYSAHKRYCKEKVEISNINELQDYALVIKRIYTLEQNNKNLALALKQLFNQNLALQKQLNELTNINKKFQYYLYAQQNSFSLFDILSIINIIANSFLIFVSIFYFITGKQDKLQQASTTMNIINQSQKHLPNTQKRYLPKP